MDGVRIALSQKSIRRHQRIPYAGPVRISWQGADGQPRYVQGRCLDVSEGGLRIESAEPVPVRALIQLNAERLKISGSATVKHSARRGAKYLLGLELNAALLERALRLATEAKAHDHPVPA